MAGPLRAAFPPEWNRTIRRYSRTQDQYRTPHRETESGDAAQLLQSQIEREIWAVHGAMVRDERERLS